MAMSEREILSTISNELCSAIGGSENGSVNGDRQAALATYLGQPTGTEVEGKSSVVSTDVADAIEWIMPEIVKAFTQNNEVVTFDATSSKDELQAEMESNFVYDILMKNNDGFIVIHQFVKDALLQKNGFIKVHYEDNISEKVESYTGLTEMEVQAVVQSDEVEVVAMSAEVDADGVEISNLKVKRTTSKGCIKVVSVPPEDFRVNRQHNSVNVDGARFAAHVVLKTAGDLIADGISQEDVDTIPTADNADNSDYRFYMQGESITGEDTVCAALRPIEVAECYMYIDLDGDGVAEYMQITVAGGDNPTVVLNVETVETSPFISATAIMMSHKLLGLSVFDRLKQIQDQKTTLWRNILDNMYLQNNQRTIAVENQVNLDDLMVSRPGGIIRVKRLDAIAPYATPPLPSDAYKMMDYLDQVRASRVGVSPEGPVTDSMIGDRVGSEGVEKMMSQKEELVGLMIRVIAETGIKPLCYKIREQAILHQDVVTEYKFRGMWVPVNPSTWASRTHSTVRVGTGSGNRKEQQQAITQIMLIQEKMMANPNQALVNETKLFTAVDDFAKFSGMSGAGKYFLDPMSPEGQQKRQQADQASQEAKQKQDAIEQSEVQFKTQIAQAETSKAQTAQQNVQLKAQVDQGKNELQAMKQQSDSEINLLKQQLDEAQTLISEAGSDKELTYKYWDSTQKHAIQREQIHASAKAASDNNNNKESTNEE